MALESKVGWAKLRVGVVSILSLLILAVLIWLISGSSGLFEKKQVLYTYLGDSAAVSEGAPVRLNGILIGVVSHVGLSGSDDPARIVRVEMKIQERFLHEIPIDSQSGIDAENLLGTKYINITKGKSPQTVQPGAEIMSQETPELTDFVKQGATTLAAMQGILTKLDSIINSIESGKGTIGELLFKDDMYNQLMAVVGDARKVTGALNSTQGTLGELLYTREFDTQIQDTLGRVNKLVDDVDHGPGAVGRLMQDPALYNDVRGTLGDFRSILVAIQTGKGTVGKLIYSDDLSKQVTATIGRLDTLLDKINSGEGTLGQLVVNPALYDSLNGVTRNMQDLLKAFRTDPRKFLHVKVSLF